MVQVRIVGVAVDSSAQHLILLKPLDVVDVRPSGPWRKNFNRATPLEVSVPGEINPAHTAGAEQRFQLVNVQASAKLVVDFVPSFAGCTELRRFLVGA